MVDHPSYQELRNYHDAGKNLRWTKLAGIKQALEGEYENLAGAKLVGAKLALADLRGANLAGIDLSYALLGGAYLCGANLTSANLTGANYSNYSPMESVYDSSDGSYRRLRSLSLDLGDLKNLTPTNHPTLRSWMDTFETKMDGASFNTNLRRVITNFAADFDWSDPTAGLSLFRHPATMELNDIARSCTHLEDTKLIDANLSGANLEYAVLTGANLTSADLTDVVGCGADLINANLTDAKLIGCDLSGANLSYADLTRVDLTGCKLADANLTQANLTGANLTGAYLIGVDLSSVIGKDPEERNHYY